jgi:hypothetical protein
MSYFLISGATGTGSAGTLQQTLANGNETLGNNIIVSDGDNISFGDAKFIPFYGGGFYGIDVPTEPGKLALVSDITDISWNDTLTINNRALQPAETNSYFVFRNQVGLSLDGQITLTPAWTFPNTPRTVQIPNRDGIIALNADIALPNVLNNDNTTSGNNIQVSENDNIFFAASNSALGTPRGINVYGFSGGDTSPAVYSLQLPQKNDTIAVLSDIPLLPGWTALTIDPNYSGSMHYQEQTGNTSLVYLNFNIQATVSGITASVCTLPAAIRPNRTLEIPIRIIGLLSIGYVKIFSATSGANSGIVQIFQANGNPPAINNAVRMSISFFHTTP